MRTVNFVVCICCIQSDGVSSNVCC